MKATGEPEGRLLGVGIDVSKASLAVAMRYEGKEVEREYCNDLGGIGKLLEALAIPSHQATPGGSEPISGGYKIVMESTGRYHLLPALRLSEAGLDVRVVNPLLAQKYSRSQVRKVKSDRADARSLAQMALHEPRLPTRFRADPYAVHLRQKMGLMASMEKQLQALKATLKDYRHFQEQLKIQLSKAEQQLATIVQSLAQQLALLEREIQALILAQTPQSQLAQKLQTVPGFSPTVAALLSQFLDPTCEHPKQWIAFTGMDISVRQSGQWWGKGKLTKRGNPYLRKRLYSAAWGAAQNYPDFQRYYQQLRQQSRSHVESLLIIARKLLRIAFYILKNNLPYDPKLAFPDFYPAPSSAPPSTDS